MTQKLYIGYNDPDFANPANWFPAGTPTSGDVGNILRATTVATGTLPANVTLYVTIRAIDERAGKLVLQNATVPRGTWIDAYTAASTYAVAFPASLSVVGALDNAGTIVFGGGAQTVQFPTGATVLNEGTLAVDDAAPTFSGGSGFTNNGLIRIVDPDRAAGQLATFSLAIGGTGTISVSANAAASFGAAVAAGQSVVFSGGLDAGTTIRIDAATLFAGTIGGFSRGDTLLLGNTTADAVAFVPNGPASGTLQLSNAGAPVASLALSGVYATGNFAINQTGSSLAITTTVTDPTTGGTAPPAAAGLFRFFDRLDGTHFLTASVAERDTVAVHRPDLVQEPNDFGAATPASAGTEPVFRFFDTVHGTHFFTASTAERDGIVATRPDLQYEPTATFLEHAVAQPGDVAVFRLFSSGDGTHFYTASATELNGLTTPGTAGFRPDLRPEGIAFYAPSGTYT